MTRPARTLTDQELEIMKVVWQQSPITVKDVQTAIRPRRTLAYTTVMTIMHRMHHNAVRPQQAVLVQALHHPPG